MAGLRGGYAQRVVSISGPDVGHVVKDQIGRQAPFAGACPISFFLCDLVRDENADYKLSAATVPSGSSKSPTKVAIGEPPAG